MTSLVPLSRRIQIIKDVLFNKLNLSHDDLSFIGRFFGEASRHWSERELAQAFSQFDSYLQLRKKIDRFYSCEHGKYLQRNESIAFCLSSGCRNSTRTIDSFLFSISLF